MKQPLPRPAFFLIASILTLCTKLASAHPGPAGHTHADDWPFGLVAGLVGAVLVMCAVRLIAKRS